MLDRRWLYGIISLCVAAVTVWAQQAPNVQYWNAGKLHPCTGDSVQVMEVMEYFRTGEQITLTVLDMSREWTNFNDYYSERSDFIHGAIALAGQQCGSGGTASLTATAANSTFKQAVFTNLAVPRMAAEQTPTSSPALATSSEQTAAAAEPSLEAEAGKAVQLEVATETAAPRVLLPPNNVTTDLEWNLFKQNGASGSNYALRAGYSRTLSNEKITCGGMLVANTMVMLDKIFFNNALNAYGTYLIEESSSLERKVGGSLNMFLVDKTFYGTPFGVSLVASFSDNRFIRSDNILTYGLMAQQSFVGDIKTTLLTAGALYGLPLGKRFALNSNAIYAINLVTVGRDGVVDVENRSMLQPALSLTTYFSRLFSLDLGVKSTFLVSDYSDLVLTLGSVILF